MDPDLSPLFEPLTIKSVRLRNRIVRTAHGTGLSRGTVTEDLIAYHVQRARHGVALSFADSGEVHWSSPGMIDTSSDDAMDGVRRLVDAVHAEGMKLFQQLMHGGLAVVPHDGSAPWGPSAIPDPRLAVVGRPMTKNMIDELVVGFAGAARRVQLAGMDGVEVHAGHGYVFSAFLSPNINRRQDEYGGDLEGRSRFLVETLRAVRAQVGPDFVVGVRLSPDGYPGHSTSDDIIWLAKTLEELGLIDYVNASWGSHYNPEKVIGTTRLPRAYQLPVTSEIARATSLPAMVTGRILDLAGAAQIVRSGQADLVSMVRALLADPELITKTRGGRLREVRPCISCSQACAGGLNTRGRIGCVVNAGGGRELTTGDHLVTAASTPRRVLVVGGGPAGLEAARVAALAGHTVTLAERERALGGQLRVVANSPSRAEVAGLIPYYESVLAAGGVDVQLGREIGTADVDEIDPDVVVLATGAVPRRDGFQVWHPETTLPGVAEVEVLTGWDVLGGAELVGPVLLVDELGHYEPIDVAEKVLAAGHELHYVTRLSGVGAALPLDPGYAAGPFTGELLRHGAHLYPRTMVTRVAPGRASLCQLNDQQTGWDIEVSTFVFVSGYLPNESLRLALDDRRVIAVGDVNGPRYLEAAIHEGFRAGCLIDERPEDQRWVRFLAGSAV